MTFFLVLLDFRARAKEKVNNIKKYIISSDISYVSHDLCINTGRFT